MSTCQRHDRRSTCFPYVFVRWPVGCRDMSVTVLNKVQQQTKIIWSKWLRFRASRLDRLCQGFGLLQAWNWHGTGMELACCKLGTGLELAGCRHGAGVLQAWNWHGTGVWQAGNSRGTGGVQAWNWRVASLEQAWNWLQRNRGGTVVELSSNLSAQMQFKFLWRSSWLPRRTRGGWE